MSAAQELELPIPVTRPWLGPEEEQAVLDVLRSGWLSQGPCVVQFEEALAGYVGARVAVATTSCTTALHLALLLAGVGPGDEVICPSYTFVATANAIRFVGAIAVFADIDPQTYTLAPDAVRGALTRRTRAILAVHQFGLPADLDGLRAVAEEAGVPLIEDAAPALGAEYRGCRIGGESYLACFSFHPRKVITTGEGGLLVTNDQALARRACQLRSHGASIPDLARHRAGAPLFEQYTEVGFNYRMTDLQAAVGLVQMGRLEKALELRRALAQGYDQAFGPLARLIPPHVPPQVRHTFQSYPLRIEGIGEAKRNALLQALADQGVSARRGIPPIHREPAYAGTARHPLPVTEAVAASTLLLPLYPTMTVAEQAHVIDAVVEALRACGC